MNTFNENKNWQEFTPKCEFRIKSEKTYSVVVSAFWRKPLTDHESGWSWNVYATIESSHKLYEDEERLRNLPFNGGCTYDKIFTESYLDCKYRRDLNAISYKKFGSDYQHIHDNYDSHQSPEDGIPHYVMRDAEELIEALENWS